MERFALFAIHPGGGITPPGWVNLHLLLWKHLVALLTRIEMDGHVFAASKVWAPAWIRLRTKIRAHEYATKEIIRRADSRGEPPPKLDSRSKTVSPFAEYDEDGKLVWDEKLVKRLEELGK